MRRTTLLGILLLVGANVFVVGMAMAAKPAVPTVVRTYLANGSYYSNVEIEEKEPCEDGDTLCKYIVYYDDCLPSHDFDPDGRVKFTMSFFASGLVGYYMANVFSTYNPLYPTLDHTTKTFRLSPFPMGSTNFTLFSDEEFAIDWNVLEIDPYTDDYNDTLIGWIKVERSGVWYSTMVWAQGRACN